MRITALLCLLLLSSQQLLAQDAEPDGEPQVEAAAPDADIADEPGEPEVILEPPGSQQDSDEDAALADEPEEVEDVPSRVARLSLIEGTVTIAPAGAEEWAEAVLNRPLTTGDRVQVDSGGRAELQLGSTSIYLDEGTGLSFVELSDGTLRVSITEGNAVIRVRRKQRDEVLEVATSNTTIALLRPGEYSIEADPDGTATTVRTRSGEAEVANERESYRVRARQQGVFEGTERLQTRITELDERSDFESFANERERRDTESRSANYVSRDVIGYEDLDDHGDWIDEPEYGYVWRPRLVAVGWVPYRYGRWAYISPWGWTWIDRSPWGFAPFHYGRWAYLKSRWCWVPGPRHFRPVYAPAVVGWTGGSSLSVSVSFGSGVGWFPLGPRELYVPPYRYSPRYARNLNVSNTIIINNTFVNNIYRSGGPRGWRNGRQSAFLDYRYRKQAAAVTLVERNVFVAGRPIDGRFSKLDQRQWQRARHDGIPPRIDPQRSSLLAGQAVQRNGWQERFNRVERNFRVRDERRADLASRLGQQRLSDDTRNRFRERQQLNGQPNPLTGLGPQQQRNRRWQDRDSIDPRRLGGNGSGDVRRDQEQRWQDRDRDDRNQIDGRRGRDEPRRWQDQGQGDRQREQAERQRRWQEQQNQQREQQQRRWQDQQNQQREERQRRWQEQQNQQRNEPPRRWQDQGQREQRREDQRRERWQDRGRPSGQTDYQQLQGDQRRNRQSDQMQDRQQRWQDRGQRDQGERQRRWQDQGQREERAPQQQQQQRREDRGGRWQQRSNDDGGRNNHRGSRYQQP